MDENEIARLATRQRGVVTTRQLHAAGFNDAAIKRRCRAGRLHRLYRGVYLVGHSAAPDLAAEVAALLACGPGTVISHRSAARLWELPGHDEPATAVEVTMAGRPPRRRPGLQVHRLRTLDRRDLGRVHGIPVTTPARTLLDLATVLRFHELEVALLDARMRRLVHDRELSDLLDRNPGRRGAKLVRRLIELSRDDALTRSEAERRFLALIRTAALPRPQANTRIGRFEVDFVWPEQRVVVEVDGYSFHSGRRAFERDRERDAALVAQGYIVLRVTWQQLIARREAVAARVAAALAIRA